MSEQTKPCEFCGFPLSPDARSCSACGQPVLAASQAVTVMSPRRQTEKPTELEEMLQQAEDTTSDENTITAAKPEDGEENENPSETPPPPLEPFPSRSIPDYPVVTPKPPPKKGRTTLVIVLILVGGLVCLLGAVVSGYFLVRSLSARFQPTVQSLVGSEKTVSPTMAEATFVPIPLEATVGNLLPEVTSVPEFDQPTPVKPDVPLQPSENQIATDTYIFDDFSSDALGWADSFDEISVHQMAEDAYSILVKEPEYIAWTNVPVDFSPVGAEFDVWVPAGGDGGSFGILCHYQSESDYYYVEMDLSDLSYSIGHYLDGDYMPLLDPSWPETNALNPGSAVNHVLVTCDLDLITLFINDEYVGQASLTEQTKPGEMAIFGSTWDDMPLGGYKVYFDNFSAWKPVQ